MCESNAYLLKNGERELLMENVSQIVPEDEGVTLRGLLGKEKFVRARIKRMDLMEHELILEEGAGTNP